MTFKARKWSLSLFCHSKNKCFVAIKVSLIIKIINRSLNFRKLYLLKFFNREFFWAIRLFHRLNGLICINSKLFILIYSLAVIGITLTAIESPWAVKAVATPLPLPWLTLINPFGARIFKWIPVVLVPTAVSLSTILKR